MKQRAHRSLPLVVALATSIVTVLVIGLDHAGHGDATAYMDAARSLLTREAYPREPVDNFFFRPPGYPALIAIVFAVSSTIGALKLVHVALFVATCLVVAAIGRRTAGEHIGTVAGCLYALHPFALRYVADVQTEPLFTFLVVTAVYLLLRANESVAFAAFAGMATGAAALVRPTALAVGAALGVTLMLCLSRSSSWRVGVARGLVVALGAAAVVMPWTVANLRATGDVLPVADGGGFHVWVGNHPDALGLYTPRPMSLEAFDRLNYPHLLVDLPRAQIAEWEASSVGYAEHSIGTRDRLWLNAALERMRDDPSTTVRLWLHKTWALWQPWLRADHYGVPISLATGLIIGALYAAAIHGAIRLWRTDKGRELVVLVVVLAVSTTLVHVATHVLLRFRVAYVDPLLVVLAVAGLADLWRRARRRLAT